MFKYTSGDKVKKGNYWNFTTGELVRFDTEGILPGKNKDIYLRAPAGVLLFVIAPVLGLVYAVFLPIVGIAIPFIVGGRKILNKVGVHTEWHKEPHPAPAAGTKDL